MRKSHNTSTPRGRSAGIGSIILIGGLMMMIVALIGVIVSFSGAIESTYMSLAFETPKFHYDVDVDPDTSESGEIGNEMFEAFALIRYLAVGVFGAVLIVAGISKVMEASETGIMAPGTANKMISKSMMFMLVIVIFPPIWDIGSDTMENISYWVLNPAYSFNPDSPCPDDWSADKIRGEYERSPYIKSVEKAVGIGDPQDVCKPELKVSYVFSQMLRNTEDTETRMDQHIRNEILGVTNMTVISDADALKEPRRKNPDTAVNATTQVGTITNYITNNAWLGNLQHDVQKGIEGTFTNVFLGLTKALVALQILIMALLIGIMADMLVAMVAAGLPIFLMLSLIPKVDKLANQMLEALPALLLLPLMSAVIIVVGAGAVAEAGGLEDGVESKVSSHLYTWITSIGVVFFAITLPVIMVPLLGSVTQMATQIVSSAVNTSTMVTGMAATSGATAAMDANKAGKGIKGIMGAFGSGMAGGALASHASVGAPGNLGPGSVGIPTGQMQSAIGQGVQMGHSVDPDAANLKPVGEQEKIIGTTLEKIADESRNKAHATGLLNQGVITHGWDSTKSDVGNREIVETELEKFVKNNTNEKGNLDIEPKKQMEIDFWKGTPRVAHELGTDDIAGRMVHDKIPERDQIRVSKARSRKMTKEYFDEFDGRKE